MLSLLVLFSDLVTCNNDPRVIGLFIDRNYSAGSNVSIVCTYPYVLNGDPIYGCGEDGVWYGNGTCSKFCLSFYH